MYHTLLVICSIARYYSEVLISCAFSPFISLSVFFGLKETETKKEKGIIGETGISNSNYKAITAKWGV
jgi:hypothetical protein